MKGMQKIKRGKQFSGVVLYSLKPGSHHKIIPYVIGGNMTGSNATELISEFDSAKKIRPDVAKPVWHNSLRLPEGETLTVRQWTAFADEYMARMGFTDTHLRCYILHDDFCGQHIHIIANRINMTSGKLYLGKNENLISTRIISELEIVHGLTQTTQANGIHRQNKRKPSRNELKMAERTAEPCPKSQLQTLIDDALTCRPDLLTFVRLLEQEGVACKPNIASTGKMNGFSFQYQGIAFKASQFGKKYGWSTLQTLIDVTPEHLVLLKQARKPTVPAFVPMPSCKPEEQTVKREAILEKIHKIEEKIRLERQQETVSVIQLRSKLHNTALQIPRQRRLYSWLVLLGHIVALLRRRGMSLLHATAHPFHQILHLHLLTPCHSMTTNPIKEQLVKNNPHPAP
ncbi:relaxase/mobilization nuclease domain-containing protein [Salmonella enterica subsp. enterica]|nr:relaxase [Salmonella enterica]EBQ9480098.1 relaxase [Salmonella enterica subsp. enterica serovar Kokomlemle]ECS5198552.1 relaxase [Salmonella enterica subsp. enterica serovar Poano]EBJ7122044.1 relaxase [Salmonella enterica]ECX4751480.1 relaxase/mobilization nuclease domain-containing protein [Salmonella enterica]